MKQWNSKCPPYWYNLIKNVFFESSVIHCTTWSWHNRLHEGIQLLTTELGLFQSSVYLVHPKPGLLNKTSLPSMMVRNGWFSSHSVHREMQIFSNETKLGMNIVWEIPHLMVVLTHLWLTMWHHKQHWNFVPKFKILFLTFKSV